MSDLEPKTRREVFLNGLSDSEQTLPEPVTREQMVLKKAIEAGGGGSSLPEVTTEDEGKALVVNSEGVWDKGEIKGAPLTVDLDYNSTTKQATIRTEGVSTSDLYNKLLNGENIYLRLWSGTTSWKGSVGYSDTNVQGGAIYANFIGVSDLSPSELLLQIAKITPNSITCSVTLYMAVTETSSTNDFIIYAKVDPTVSNRLQLYSDRNLTKRYTPNIPTLRTLMGKGTEVKVVVLNGNYISNVFYAFKQPSTDTSNVYLYAVDSIENSYSKLLRITIDGFHNYADYITFEMSNESTT